MGIYQTLKETGIRVDRRDVQLELNSQSKSLAGITVKGQDKQSYDSEL